MSQDVLIRLAALLTIFAFVFLSVQLFSTLVLSRYRERKQINRRLDLLRKGMSREQVIQIIRQRTQAFSQDGLVGRTLNRLHRMHARSAISTSAATTFLISAGAVLVIFLLSILGIFALAYDLTVGRVVLAMCLSLALGFGLPLFFLSQRAQKRTKLMEEQFPVALDIFIRALRSGHPVAAAVELLTEEMPDPVGSEFGLVFDEVSYGLDFNSAIHNMADRWDLPDLHMFAVSLTVQSETGGNLAEILTNLSATIRDRASLYLKVRALSAEGRMTAWVLTVMPVLTFIVLFVVNPSFFLDVADDPIFIYGFVFLIALYVVGVIWLRRLVDLKV